MAAHIKQSPQLTMNQYKQLLHFFSTVTLISEPQANLPSICTLLSSQLNQAWIMDSRVSFHIIYSLSLINSLAHIRINSSITSPTGSVAQTISMVHANSHHLLQYQMPIIFLPSNLIFYLLVILLKFFIAV